jgi:hypothetical protein
MIDLTSLNANDWILGWDETREADIVSARTHIAIPAWTIPRFFEKHIILAGTSITSANNQWRVGCTLQILASYQNFPLNDAIIRDEIIPPNGNRLIILPRHSGDYKIKVRVPPWHKDLSLIIYEFNGEYETFTERLVKEKSDNIINLLS